VTLADADDALLVARARTGDEPAFRALVERHASAVARTAMALLGDGDEADDVGQQAFMQLHRSLHGFRGDATLRTYLLRITTNLALNALRSRRRRAKRFLREDTAGDTVPDAAPGALQQLEREELRERLARAIADLPEPQRLVVMHRLVEARSTKETAEALQLPDGTVLSRLSRGLAALRRTLQPPPATPDQESSR